VFVHTISGFKKARNLRYSNYEKCLHRNANGRTVPPQNSVKHIGPSNKNAHKNYPKVNRALNVIPSAAMALQGTCTRMKVKSSE